MPPKKQPNATTKAPAKTAKSITKKAATTKKSAATTTTAPKGRTPAKKATATTKKGTSAPAKSRQTKTTSAAATATATATEPVPAPAPKKRKAEASDKEQPAPKPKKARATKAQKPKVVINSAPTTRLDVFVCGEGSSGELGLGAGKNAIDVKRPVLNPNLLADQVGVVQIATGGMHCVALTHDNKILTWGVNDLGALGRDTTWDGGYKDIKDANKNDSDDDSDDDTGLNPRESTPTTIPSESFAEGAVFVEVVAGDSSSFALTDDGQVYGWGTFRVSLSFLGGCWSGKYDMLTVNRAE